MVIAVRTEQHGDDLVVVKQARTDGDVARLSHEATMLARCQHPGVVELLGIDDRSIRLRHAGTALARLDPLPIDEAAGVVSAVADVVHAMHRLGVAHADLDGDHVLLDQRGRPRLCGFGRAVEADDAATAADVAALGRLLRTLLADGADLRWARPPAGLGKRKAMRRARRDLETLVNQATQADAARRPSARQFAKALHRAVPELHLPAPTSPTAAHTFAALPDDISPTADFGWTAEDLHFLATEADVEDAERELPPIISDSPLGPDRARIELGPEILRPDLLPHEPEPPVSVAVPDTAAPPAAGRRIRQVAFATAVIAVLTGGVVVGAAGARAVRPLGGESTQMTTPTTEPPPSSAPTDTTPRTPPPRPEGCPTVATPGADVDGDGCPEAVELDGSVVTMGSVTLTIGQDGDQVVIGDWNCDGVNTPAVLRPSTGEVFVFTGWRIDETTEIGPLAVVPDATAIARGASTCPDLELTTPDGIRTVDPYDQ